MDAAHLASHPAGVDRLPGCDLGEALPVELLAKPIEGHDADRIQTADGEDIDIVALAGRHIAIRTRFARQVIAVVAACHAAGRAERDCRNARE